MKDKRFEHRYVTLKVEDIKHFLSRDEQESLEDMCNKIADYRKAAGRPPLEGIFIGSDWPEYEPTAKALHTRINKPTEHFNKVTPESMQLANEIASAVLADECAEGCDVSAGIFGTNFSQSVIKLAKQELK